MKAKDFIIIGGAIALYYLYQKNKTKTSDTSAEEEAQDGATSGGGGGMPIVETPKPVIPIIKGETTTGGEAIFTGVPISRNLTNPAPIITPIESAIQNGGASTIPTPAIVVGSSRNITNPAPIVTPIESAIQNGGASTTPTPTIPSQPSISNQNELINPNIQPIVRGTRSL